MDGVPPRETDRRDICGVKNGPYGSPSPSCQRGCVKGLALQGRPYLPSILMIIICWNVRGAACTKFRPTVMELIRNHHVDILVLCEPRISGKKAADTMKSLGFPCYEIVDSISFSGGLWLLWKDTNVNIEIIGTTDQSITTCVTSPGKSPWLLTTIYVSPCGPKQEKLWEYLDLSVAAINCHGFLLETLMKCCMLRINWEVL
ncbi:unnamed protein product [Prunus armeniaca]